MYVTRKYATTSQAVPMLADATAKPRPRIDEPTYRGCRISRYGPDRVTSRPFSIWPAAQTRNAWPTSAMPAPAMMDLGVGDAIQNAPTNAANPRGTRIRASQRNIMADPSAFLSRALPRPR